MTNIIFEAADSVQEDKSLAPNEVAFTYSTPFGSDRISFFHYREMNELIVDAAVINFQVARGDFPQPAIIQYDTTSGESFVALTYPDTNNPNRVVIHRGLTVARTSYKDKIKEIRISEGQVAKEESGVKYRALVFTALNELREEIELATGQSQLSRFIDVGDIPEESKSRIVVNHLKKQLNYPFGLSEAVLQRNSEFHGNLEDPKVIFQTAVPGMLAYVIELNRIKDRSRFILFASLRELILAWVNPALYVDFEERYNARMKKLKS
jgi:hypothetical protein